MMAVLYKALLAVVMLVHLVNCQQASLPYITLGSGTAVVNDSVGHFDDGVSQAIIIPGTGYPFGNRLHQIVYIGINGYFAFTEPFYLAFAEEFPGTTNDVSNAYLVAPFWDDIDLRRNGSIDYEVHTSTSSPSTLSEVSSFISARTGNSFSGNWMLVAQWDKVHSWPNGESDALRNLYLVFFGIDSTLINTFQGIVITDGTNSYAVFTYRCGDINWTLSPATIGYNAAGAYYQNHPNTGLFSVDEIDCFSQDFSEYHNELYNISVSTPGVTLAPPPTVEPPQTNYLEYLEPGANVLDRCRNCSSPAIALGSPGLPFGGYYHSSLYVGTNGIFGFGDPWIETSPAEWPTEEVETFFTWAVSPYWSDIDTRLDGEVRWQVYNSAVPSDQTLIAQVQNYVNSEITGVFSNPTMMVVATWSNVHPFPHGESEEQDRQDPYLQRANKFQGIIITNGEKSYSVFTYHCNDIEWSDSASIGYNAGGSLYDNHPLSGHPESRVIGCVHTTADPPSEWNNVLFDLTTVPTNAGNTPEPGNSVGSCAAAGYDTCCRGDIDLCFGSPGDCFCDSFCVNFGDCCADQPAICQDTVDTDNGTYLLFADHFYIGKLGLDTDTEFSTLPLNILQGASVLDFDYMRDTLYWYDYIEDAVFRSNLNGTNPIRLFNTSEFGAIEDIAFDWVSNKLYLTETFHRRIDVYDVEANLLVPLLDAAPNSGIRGIAVDPVNREMYWTDWGNPAMIEKASMDGSNRRVLHSTNILRPNGITVDYDTQRIYWTDSQADTIEYSTTDGQGRQILQSDVPLPYGISVEGSFVFFTDWINNGVHMAHKINQGNITTYTNAFTLQPVGIQAIAPQRQPDGTNFCAAALCDHVCVLSTNTDGFSCLCQDGYELGADGTSCTFVGTDAPPAEGSCTASGYSDCCDGGFCAGSPPTCFCDMDCYDRGDCCSDIDSVCELPSSSCANAGYTSCCTDFTFGCTGVSAAGICYCDDSCYAFGDCCDDIDTTCPLPTTEPTEPPPTLPPSDDSNVLEYFELGVTAGVVTESVGHFDDGVSHAINVQDGFPFGDQLHTFIFISTNGIISFTQPFYTLPPELFPGVSTTVSAAYLVAPFWSDVDITDAGAIRYEVHSGSVDDNELLSSVSDFISNRTLSSFSGTWALLVSWEDVHPWPNGIADEFPFWTIIFPDYADSNSYQAIIITDGTDSYALFTYRCGDMEWARGGVIGYNAAGTFINHPLSGETGTPSIACSNQANSPWTNVVYQLAVSELSTALPPTVEPPQTSYLPMLEFTPGGATSLAGCNNCTSEAINVPNFPFGIYYHSTAFVATNGLISFGRAFLQEFPEPFPAVDDLMVFSSYLVAPYWSNIDTRLEGSVSYQVFLPTDANVGNRFTMVNQFLRAENATGGADFNGNWMLVATWDGVHPFPHGASAEQDREDPYLQTTNTFQAILVTDGTKGYAIFTYTCDTMGWSDEATIGYNAAGDDFMLHPLSGMIHASAIDCVHGPGTVNNVVYDLAPTTPIGTVPPPVEKVEVPFIVGQTSGVDTQLGPAADDGATEPISINLSPGFPFANSYQTQAYVVTNGLINFGEDPFTLHIPYSFPTAFPEVYDQYVLAPFWADADLSVPGFGNIRYEVHDSSVVASSATFDIVNNYIRNNTGTSFTGTWMLAVLWDEIHPYAGFFPGSEANTFQAIAISDGQDSYAVYTYKCGELEWSNGAVIGYNGGSANNYYAVHPLSGSDDAQTISCLEFPNSEWTNVLYKISIEEVVTSPPPVTVEPGQDVYLEFIDKTGINQEVLPSCDDCHSNSVSMPGIPFGSYRHTKAYVSTNGIISFGDEFTQVTNTLFPSTIANVHFAYAIAPYWADIDARFSGEVWLETHVLEGDRVSADLLDSVTNLVRSETGDSGFTGDWMLVATWDAVRMYSGAAANVNFDENTFQAIIISDKNLKTYAVFTYKCDLITWSEEATIGINAAGGYFINHPLAGTTVTDAIDCVHNTTDGSVWNNVVYNMVPGGVLDIPTPEPPNSFGSCIEAGHTECCTDIDCIGSSPGDCFCDSSCHQFGDCCHDIVDTCNTAPTQLNTTLLIAAQYNVIKLNGSTVENLLVNDFNSLYVAIDFDYRNGYIYYSDVAKDEITRINWDGSDRQIIVNTNMASVDGIAFDWVNNKLYWTDAILQLIQVFDLATEARSTLVELHIQAAPRAIVLDPVNRMMYWTDWGVPGAIERASMDGSNRETLHSTGVNFPFGLTIDLPAQRIYWTDSFFDRIEYSNTDGSGRTILETADTGLSNPFGLTLDSNVLYWTDWTEDSVFSTHKLLGSTVVPVYENIQFTPSGIEAVNPDRQPMASNPCDGISCGHMCVLSTSVLGYACVCPPGEQLMANGRDCTDTATDPPATTGPGPGDSGSCSIYNGCCQGGACAGVPADARCFCDDTCNIFGDCCPDYFDLNQPVPASNLQVMSISSIEFNVSWSFPDGLSLCDDSFFRVEVFSLVDEPIRVFFDRLDFNQRFISVDSGVVRFVPYNVTVTAGNFLGDTPTLHQVAFTEQGVPTVAPSNVNINRFSGTMMEVSWDPLSLAEAQGFIVSYTVSYTPSPVVGGPTKRQSNSVQVTATSASIDGLTPGVTYDVSVRANTAAGSGPGSVSVGTGLGPSVGVNGGAVAGGVIVVVVVAVLVVAAIALAGIFIFRKRTKTTDSEEYARFSNDQVNLSRADSPVSASVNNPDPTPATVFESDTVKPISYKILEESQRQFDNPGYGEVRRADDVNPYAPVGGMTSQAPPGYSDVTGIEKVSLEPPPSQVETGYQPVGELVPGEEVKEDLGETEKKDWATFSDEV